MEMNKIHFHNADRKLNIRNKKKLKDFIKIIFIESNKPFESINYIFCSDTYLLKINKEFLQHNYFTDIITFNLSDKGSPVNGEIYISIDRVRDNANLLHNTFNNEVHRVIFHGVLHLCGYKDKTKADKRAMRVAEDHYLERYA